MNNLKKTIHERRGNLPSKYKKYTEPSYSTTDIMRTIKVSYNIGKKYTWNLEEKLVYMRPKAQWFRIINVHPSCNETTKAIAKSYGGVILDESPVEMEITDYTDMKLKLNPKSYNELSSWKKSLSKRKPKSSSKHREH